MLGVGGTTKQLHLWHLNGQQQPWIHWRISVYYHHHFLLYTFLYRSAYRGLQFTPGKQCVEEWGYGEALWHCQHWLGYQNVIGDYRPQCVIGGDLIFSFLKVILKVEQFHSFFLLHSIYHHHTHTHTHTHSLFLKGNSTRISTIIYVLRNHKL